MTKANNASFGALAAYDDWVAAMTHWWTQLQNGQPASPEVWKRFYAQMQELASMQPEQRNQQLCAHQPEQLAPPAACQASTARP